MLGLAERVVEVHRGGEDDGVTHFVQGVGNPVAGQGVEELFGGLGDGFACVGEVDIEGEGEVVTQVALLEEKVPDALDVFLELDKVWFVGELVGEGEV